MILSLSRPWKAHWLTITSYVNHLPSALSMTVYTDLQSYVYFFREDSMHLIAVGLDLEPAGIRTHASAINWKRRLRSDCAANSAIVTCCFFVLGALVLSTFSFDVFPAKQFSALVKAMFDCRHRHFQMNKTSSVCRRNSWCRPSTRSTTSVVESVDGHCGRSQVRHLGWDSPSSKITVFSFSIVFHWKIANQRPR